MPSTDLEEPPRASNKHDVAKAAIASAAGLAGLTITILIVAGRWNIDPETVRYALTVIAVITGLALGTAVLVSRR